MNRSLVILLAALTLAGGVFAASFFGARHVGMICMSNSTDDLTWLRDEFHLSGAEMARIQELHEGYLPKCAEMCAKIAAKKEEIAAALGDGTNVTADVQQKLIDLGELRARCQAQMLEHFVEVSRAMPHDEGRRYLAEMERLTLGAHEDVEQTMSHEHHHE
ncbi:MAG TPA: periplasmic heavy metal sensor [Verrucomicrobiae bacterium]|nr:periplasmic heavy metal sensor [Verrucomicrobiae bacterium]